MPRIRTIKPEFWKHELLSELPESTHLLAAALLNYADDQGYFNANPKLIKSECCPLREDSVSIHDSLTHLARIGYLQLGSDKDGRRYGRVANFLAHQKINRPTPSKISGLEIVWDDSLSTHGGITESSLPERKGKEGNRKGKEKKEHPRFAEFYDAYPRHIDRKDAEVAFRKAIEKIDPDQLIAITRRFAAICFDQGQQEKFIPHPATWLNRERWTLVPDESKPLPIHGGLEFEPYKPPRGFGYDY